MQNHNYPFFGKKVGVLFNSGDWSNDFIYLRFIKKKPSGIWEKPSEGEGRVMKFNLLEMLAIIETLNHPGTKWSTMHRFQGDSTPITFEHHGKNATILLPGYQKYLSLPETHLFLDLLKHVYNEKIQHATSSYQSDQTYQTNKKRSKFSNNNFNKSKRAYTTNKSPNMNSNSSYTNNNTSQSTHQQTMMIQANENSSDHSLSYSNPLQGEKASTLEITGQNVIKPRDWLAKLPTQNDCYLLPGNIEARSQKAVAFQVKDQNSTWIPLSCITQAENADNRKGLWVKKWFVEKRIKDILA